MRNPRLSAGGNVRNSTLGSRSQDGVLGAPPWRRFKKPQKAGDLGCFSQSAEETDGSEPRMDPEQSAYLNSGEQVAGRGPGGAPLEAVKKPQLAK